MMVGGRVELMVTKPAWVVMGRCNKLCCFTKDDVAVKVVLAATATVAVRE
jgi:hypothetical protein